MANKTTSAYYVDNAKFYQALVAYREKCQAASLAFKPRPPMPNYIGACILKIATGLGFYWKFVNYTYRDEMEADAIENAVRAVNNDNFDTTRFTNPHAYFTQIMYFAFVRRIEKEKKQSYIKHKSLQNFYVQGLTTKQPGDDNVYDLSVDMDGEDYDALVTKFEGGTKNVREE